MDKRQRIDLDGVTLSGPDSAETVAVFRHRSVEGLVLSMPESADIVIDWRHVARADLSLVSGKLIIVFDASFAASANWLGGLTTLEGTWIDRLSLRLSELDR